MAAGYVFPLSIPDPLPQLRWGHRIEKWVRGYLRSGRGSCFEQAVPGGSSTPAPVSSGACYTEVAEGYKSPAGRARTQQKGATRT